MFALRQIEQYLADNASEFQERKDRVLELCRQAAVAGGEWISTLSVGEILGQRVMADLQVLGQQNPVHRRLRLAAHLGEWP